MTTTGRLNSQNPNLQNIPIRTERGQEIRKAFVARGGEYRLLSADYSQIELRILAALSRETAMLEAFKAGVDIHAATAARVFGVFPDLVTPEMRRKAKMVNFGIVYGISAFGLSQRLGIPRAEAADIIDQYFKQFPGIRRYMDETIEFARKHGLRRDRHRPPPLHPRHSLRQQHHPRRRRTQRHQRSHPGHRRRHDQARHDQHPSRAGPPEAQDPHAAPGP